MRRNLTVLVLAVLFGLTALVHAQGTDPAVKGARTKLVQWLQTNNRKGPSAPLNADMAKWVDQENARGYNLVTIVVGPGVTKSGKAYQLHMFGSEFFAFELTPAQASELSVKDDDVMASSGRLNDHRAVSPAARLDKVVIGPMIDGTQKLTGRVHCRTVGKVDGTVQLRVSYHSQGHTTASFRPIEQLPANGDLRFSFEGVNSRAEDKKITGPLVVFVDLVVVKENPSSVEFEVISNTVPVMVEVA